MSYRPSLHHLNLMNLHTYKIYIIIEELVNSSFLSRSEHIWPIGNEIKSRVGDSLYNSRLSVSLSICNLLKENQILPYFRGLAKYGETLVYIYKYLQLYIDGDRYWENKKEGSKRCKIHQDGAPKRWTGLNSGTCDVTCEGLTHAVVAFSAPASSDDAFILRDDPP